MSILVTLVVRRDALDPDFASNLSRLGQVTIQNAGKFHPVPSLAQKTLQARHDSSTTIEASTSTSIDNALPPGYLTASSVLSMLDSLKEGDADVEEVYRRYRVDGEEGRKRVEGVRRWINSPSVGNTDVITVNACKRDSH
jgi:hypothetical protein